MIKMKSLAITYTTRIQCRFTNDELAVLIKCSQAHYDGKCKSLSTYVDGCGNDGLLIRMTNFHRNTAPDLKYAGEPAPNKNPIGYRLEWHDLDLFCKVLEVHQHLNIADLDTAASLRMSIGHAMTALRDNQVDERRL